MSKQLALPALAGLLVGAVWLIAASERRTGTSSLTRPFVYGQDDVTRDLRKNGISVEVVSDVRRNASGTELFVYLFDSPTNQFTVIKITTNGLVRLPAPGRGAVPGPEGRFVVWAGDDGIHFENGQFLELPNHGLFDVDPGGTYFVVGEKPNKAWLGRVRSPLEKRVIAEDLLADGVFVSGNRIYVTGTSYTPNPSGRTDPLATCLILEDKGQAFEIIKRLGFDWAAGVVEVDPFADRLLLWDRALVSHSVYSYDLATNQRRKVGSVKGFQFFLVTDLVRQFPINPDVVPHK